MKKVLAALILAFPLAAACAADPSTSQDPTEKSDKTEQATHVCPYLVPFCDTSAGCKLVGGCPQQCVCDNGKTIQCGTQHCGPNEYCCNSTTAGNECLPVGYMCPL